MSDSVPVRISLTPTRNEIWVIKPFLEAVSQWAQHAIVADQSSTDGTLEALRANPRVTVLVNPSSTYDEAARQRLLIGAARKISGKRILLALDADEALSANVLQSNEWEKIANAKPGTVLRFRWVNVLPGFEKAWIPPNLIACGFVDDGSEHQGTTIHSRRVPWPQNAPVLDLHEIVVLHFQYVAWERVVSKHRWYQAWESLNHADKGPLQIFREYNHMYGSWNDSEILPIKSEWLSGFDRFGIDFRSLKTEAVTWWDTEIVKLLRAHGTNHFRKIDIWGRDWQSFEEKRENFSDPRSFFEALAHKHLRRTQNRRAELSVRAFEKLLRLSGW